MFSASIIFRGIDQITAPIKRMQMSTQTFAATASVSFSRVAEKSTMLATRMETLSSKMMNFRTILAGGIIYTAGKYLYDMANATVKNNIEQIKLAQRLNLSVQSMKELTYAAKMAGAGDVFNKSFMRFSKTIGEVRMGTGKLTNFLLENDRALLSSFKHAKNTDEAFSMFANSVQRVQDPMKRTAYVAMVFGPRAAAINNMFLKGSKGIEQLREEYRRLAGTTDTSSASYEEMYHAQIRLSTAFNSVKRTIAVAVSPAITDIINKMTDWIAENKKFLKTQISDAIKSFGGAIAFVVKHLDVLMPLAVAYVKTVVALKIATVGLKAVTMAATVAQYASAAAMALSYITTGTLTEGLLANSTALAIVTAWEWLATAATTAFSAALWSTGIPEIVLGVIALGVGIYMLIKHWKEIVKWVTTSNNVFAVLLRVILTPIILQFKLIAFVIGWVINKISELWGWFKDTAVFKYFVKGLMVFFEVTKKIVGWIWDKIKSIFGFIIKIAKMVIKPAIQGYDVISNSTKSLFSPNTEKPVNKDAAILTQKKIIESNSSQNVQISIDDNTGGRARVTGQMQPIPIKVNSTRGF